MSRRRYVVMYDICDDRRRDRVHDAVRGAGTRFQYSVFLCDLTRQELIGLRWELAELIDSTVDAIAIVDLGEPERIREGTFSFMGVRPAMPTGRSTVI